MSLFCRVQITCVLRADWHQSDPERSKEQPHFAKTKSGPRSRKAKPGHVTNCRLDVFRAHGPHRRCPCRKSNPRHPRASGGPASVWKPMDSRFRGNDVAPEQRFDFAPDTWHPAPASRVDIGFSQSDNSPAAHRMVSSAETRRRGSAVQSPAINSRGSGPGQYFVIYFCNLAPGA